MNALVSRLVFDLGRPVTLALVHSLWLGSAVSIVAGCILRTVPRDRSGARYAVCVFALLAILAGTAFVGARVAATDPPPRPDRITWSATQSIATSPSTMASSEAATLPARAYPADPNASAFDADAGRGLSSGVSTRPGDTAGGEDDRWSDRWSDRMLHLNLGAAGPWIFTVWVAGVVGLAIFNLAGWLHAGSIARRGTRPLPERWQRCCGSLAARLGLRRRVRALESALVHVPTVVGWIRPALLIPAASF